MEKAKMDLDAKHLVLFAIYTEYQKDLPAMAEITATSLDLPMDVFNVAADKLENEGFIDGVSRECGPCPHGLDFVKMTREGIEYVETKLEVQRYGTGREKTQLLAEKFKSYGWSALTDFAAKVFVEIGKNALYK